MKEKKHILIKIKRCIPFLIIAVLLTGIIIIYAKYQSAKKPEVTSSFINGRLESISELTTSELTYTGLMKYSEGNIPFLTQSSFSMIYTASVKAGIDISQAEIKITRHQVTITLPEEKVQSVDIDTDSIEFYDEHLALFNWTEKTDITNSISAAKKDVLDNADINGLLEHARTQTEAIIRGLLTDAVGDRDLIIR